MSLHGQTDTRDLITELTHTSKNLRLWEAACNHCPFQGYTPEFLSLFLWEAEEGKAKGRSTGTALVTGLKGTHRLDLKPPGLEFTPSSGIWFCHPQSTPDPSPRPLSEARPENNVQTVLPFSIVPASDIFCHCCTPLSCVFDAVW